MKSAHQFKLIKIAAEVDAGRQATVTCRGSRLPYTVVSILESHDHSVVFGLYGGARLVVAPEDILIVRMQADTH